MSHVYQYMIARKEAGKQLHVPEGWNESLDDVWRRNPTTGAHWRWIVSVTVHDDDERAWYVSSGLSPLTRDEDYATRFPSVAEALEFTQRWFADVGVTEVFEKPRRHRI